MFKTKYIHSFSYMFFMVYLKSRKGIPSFLLSVCVSLQAGKTALMLALEGGYYKIAEHLLRTDRLHLDMDVQDASFIILICSYIIVHANNILLYYSVLG